MFRSTTSSSSSSRYFGPHLSPLSLHSGYSVPGARTHLARAAKFLPFTRAACHSPRAAASLSPFLATLTADLQLTENPATLSPATATLTSRVTHNPCVCHSYEKHPGCGGGTWLVNHSGTANPGCPLPNLDALTPQVITADQLSRFISAPRLRERRLPPSARDVAALSFSALHFPTFDLQRSAIDLSIPLDPTRPDTYARTPDHEQDNFWNDCGNRRRNPRKEIFTSRSCGCAPRTSCGSAAEAECVCALRCGRRTQTSKNRGSSGATRRGSRATARRTADDQKLHRRRGMAGTGGIVATEGLCGAGGCAAGCTAACCGRDYFGKHQYAGIFNGVRDRQFFERQDQQSLGCSAVGGRLERRRGRGDCFRVFGWRSGKRRRRIDPRAGTFLRDLRIKADAGTDSRDGAFPGRRRRIRLDRSCRPHGQNHFRRARAV